MQDPTFDMSYDTALQTLADIKALRSKLEKALADNIDDALEGMTLPTGEMFTKPERDHFTSSMQQIHIDAMALLSDAMADLFYRAKSEAEEIVEKYELEESESHYRSESTHRVVNGSAL